MYLTRLRNWSICTVGGCGLVCSRRKHTCNPVAHSDLQGAHASLHSVHACLQAAHAYRHAAHTSLQGGLRHRSHNDREHAGWIIVLNQLGVALGRGRSPLKFLGCHGLSRKGRPCVGRKLRVDSSSFNASAVRSGATLLRLGRSWRETSQSPLRFSALNTSNRG